MVLKETMKAAQVRFPLKHLWVCNAGAGVFAMTCTVSFPPFHLSSQVTGPPNSRL